MDNQLDLEQTDHETKNKMQQEASTELQRLFRGIVDNLEILVRCQQSALELESRLEHKLDVVLSILHGRGNN